MAKPKVVIDTNVLIDGDRDDNSAPNLIIEEVLAGRIEAFANRKTIQENKLIIARILNNQEYKDKLIDYFSHLQYVEPVSVSAVYADRQDNKILGSAVAADASYLITSDWDLLRLEEYENIKIIRPEDFWNIYRQENLGQDDWQKFVNQFLSQ